MLHFIPNRNYRSQEEAHLFQKGFSTSSKKKKKNFPLKTAKAGREEAQPLPRFTAVTLGSPTGTWNGCHLPSWGKTNSRNFPSGWWFLGYGKCSLFHQASCFPAFSKSNSTEACCFIMKKSWQHRLCPDRSWRTLTGAPAQFPLWQNIRVGNVCRALCPRDATGDALLPNSEDWVPNTRRISEDFERNTFRK